MEFLALSSTSPYFYSRTIDFLGLGGFAVICLVLSLIFVPKDIDQAALISSAAILAHFINQPHFAVSYHIFYSNFFQIVQSQSYEANLKSSYLFVGVIVPLTITGLFAYSYVTLDLWPLSFCIKTMFFLVGWHYSKQGYGCLLASSVKAGVYFTNFQKNVLLLNAYSCWLYAWAKANTWAFESSYWGISYIATEVPQVAQLTLFYVFCATTLSVGVVFIFKATRGFRFFPFNGFVAYTTAVYFWVIASSIHPALFVFIPAMHSLQYLVIASKYESSYYTEKKSVSGSPITYTNPIFFWPCMALLGYVLFWGIPNALSAATTLNRSFPEGSNFVFLYFWILINLHHYFIDHVIWRRENPNLSKRLYA